MDHNESNTSGQLSMALSTVTSIAAVAPAICAVHCAAMPFIAVLLPSLQASGKVCMNKFGKRVAYYLVIPCGVLSNAVGYPQHQSAAVTGVSLTGVSCMTAAVTWKACAPYRLPINLAGCAMMLGSSYYGNQIAQKAGRGCHECCDHCN